MQPATQAISESDWLQSEMYRSSQDSFRPNNQSKFNFGDTQEEFFSTENEQFSSFKPKRELSRSDSKIGVKKKVRFADDQETTVPYSDTLFSDDKFDMNATCPIDFCHDLSFDVSPESLIENRSLPLPNDQQKTEIVNEFVPNTDQKLNFQFNEINHSSFKPHSSDNNSNHGNDNPNYTYVMREVIVKKEDDLISYTYQNSYHDNDMNSSLQHSILVNNDVNSNIVLEQKEQLENRKAGSVNFVGKRTERLNGNSNNIHMTETFASKNNSNFSSNTFLYDVPHFNMNRPNSTQNFPSNQSSHQEFDTNNYQSSQHSEFGNPFTENSDFLTSSQHSFYNNHDDEFVPKEFPKTNLYNTKLSYTTPYESDQSKHGVFSPPEPSTPQLDSSYSSSEFTPIISKLEKQLSLDSIDFSNMNYSEISDTDYL
ncbi:hypothetical protein LOD99_5991 [Oopsacas minuta]|uniref:Uncharacterized protein n=1 Tax=Oopsacas minuta TaxID=111878 RepID=A0AAV7JNA1_9METZ|nr:hypothetical protein LOD99_5991 [Oopsacas minuta]